MANEFEEIENDDKAPEQAFQDTGSNDVIASGTAGTKYDWTNAPEGVKAPPRIDLNGKTVTIKKAEIIIPPLSTPWELTKAKDKEFKFCTFSLHYDVGGQIEFVSGMRVFKRVDEKTKVVQYSHPTITRDRKSQASFLLGQYADFKKKDIAEISMREFMHFLNSGCKVKIKSIEVTNPSTKQVIKKNLPGEFVNP